jgi:cytosine/adenosine deaminase-related metal-dependent hydrolase
LGRLLLRGARCLVEGRWSEPRDVTVRRDGAQGDDDRPPDVVDVAGRWLLPALVNAHDVLDLAPLPPLGSPPYESVYAWAEVVQERALDLEGALAPPLVDRLFLGAARNVLAGVAAVLHHHPDHRSLGRSDFPVRVQRRYAFAHSPRLTPRLRRTYRTTDRRIPWIVRAAEGGSSGLRGEIDTLAGAGVLRQNTVIVHGTALAAADGGRLAAAGASLVWCPEADRRLYGRTAPVRELRAAGVRVGLGSDSAPAGARDALSNLAAARREGLFDDTTLLVLATRESAGVARLPVGDLEGTPGDLLVVDSLDGLLEGDRRAIALLLVRGEPVFGEPALVSAAGGLAEPTTVDGAPRALEAGIARRLARLVRRHPRLREASWLADVRVAV